MRKQTWLGLPASAVLALGVAACGGGGGGEDGASGQIQIDGSSTVAPLTEPVAALYSEDNPNVEIPVGTSGTGGGFERFCRGETDISNASRAIEPEEEELCQQNGVEYAEIPVANDALSVIVNPENPVTCLSPDQVAQIYGPDSNITSWSDVEGLDQEYGEPLEIFSPGADSGTFDYFTEAINGEEGQQRTEGVNIVGENDNATITGVAGSPGGIGYLGFSFYDQNREQVKALEIENPDGECVAPSVESVQAGDYVPLGRELYIYPSAEALQRPEVQEFVSFYLENLEQVTEQAGFIPLTEEQLAESRQRVEELGQGGSGGAEGTGGAEDSGDQPGSGGASE